MLEYRLGFPSLQKSWRNLEEDKPIHRSEEGSAAIWLIRNTRILTDFNNALEIKYLQKDQVYLPQGQVYSKPVGRDLLLFHQRNGETNLPRVLKEWIPGFHP